MVNVNLLPWRDAQYRYQSRQLKRYFLASLILPFMAMTIWYIRLQNESEPLREKLNGLNERWSAYRTAGPSEAQVHQEEVRRAKIQLIKQTNRKLRQFFMSFSSEASQTVCFTRVMYHGRDFIFQGRTQSSYALTDFLKHWHTSSLFSEIKLQQLIKSKQNESMQFQLKANL